MANEKQHNSFFKILAEEMRKAGFSEEEVRKLKKLYSTDKGKNYSGKQPDCPENPPKRSLRDLENLLRIIRICWISEISFVKWFSGRTSSKRESSMSIPA